MQIVLQLAVDSVDVILSACRRHYDNMIDDTAKWTVNNLTADESIQLIRGIVDGFMAITDMPEEVASFETQAIEMLKIGRAHV